MYGPEVDIWFLPPLHSALIFEIVSLLSLKFSNLATQACQPVSGICLSLCNLPTLGLQTCVIIPGFYIASGDMNSDPHACVANSLLTEPAPQLLNLKILFEK